jgi:hypothetical protein
MSSLYPLEDSYEKTFDYKDQRGNEVRINRLNSRIRQVGRFTIVEPEPEINELRPTRSYDSDPDDIDQWGNEVRINRKRPNERQIGRFTIVDEPMQPLIVGRMTKKTNLYPGQKIGRFTIKSVSKPPPKKRNSKSKRPNSPRRPNSSRRPNSPRRSNSPRRPKSLMTLGELKIKRSNSPRRSPLVKIGRFTINKK